MDNKPDEHRIQALAQETGLRGAEVQQWFFWRDDWSHGRVAEQQKGKAASPEGAPSNQENRAAGQPPPTKPTQLNNQTIPGMLPPAAAAAPPAGAVQAALEDVRDQESAAIAKAKAALGAAFREDGPPLACWFDRVPEWALPHKNKRGRAAMAAGPKAPAKKRRPSALVQAERERMQAEREVAKARKKEEMDAKRAAAEAARALKAQQKIQEKNRKEAERLEKYRQKLEEKRLREAQKEVEKREREAKKVAEKVSTLRAPPRRAQRGAED